jgi:hypothetical protein
MIYFARATIDASRLPWSDRVESGDVRIGICTDVERSQASLKSYGPVLLNTCEGGKPELTNVHFAFRYAKASTSGWFLPHPSLLAFARNPDFAACANAWRTGYEGPDVAREEMLAYHELLRRRYAARRRERDERMEARLRKLAKTDPLHAEFFRRLWAESTDVHRDVAAPRAPLLLGLTPPFTKDAVKDAYRRLAKEAHPDLGGDPARFVELEKAYRQALAAAEA